MMRSAGSSGFEVDDAVVIWGAVLSKGGMTEGAGWCGGATANEEEGSETAYGGWTTLGSTV
jgi:hypothetical protein